MKTKIKFLFDLAKETNDSEKKHCYERDGGFVCPEFDSPQKRRETERIVKLLTKFNVLEKITD